MEKPKPTPLVDARTFFSDELKSALDKQHLKVNSESVNYLTNLLLQYMHSDNFFVAGEDGKRKDPVLADLYAEIVQGDSATRQAGLRRLGDICLVVTGIFPDSLNRKIVDIDYYFGMGGTAYAELSRLQLTTIARQLYFELGDKFRSVADVLSEMSTRTGLQSNGDILRIYEKWLLTRSDRLRALLSEHGITNPCHVDRTPKQ